MGEYADMMLDGTCCQYCGEFIGSNAGFPQTCGACAKQEETQKDRYYTKRQKSEKRNHKCPLCDAYFYDDEAINNHLKVKHKSIKCEYCSEISCDWFELKAKSKNYTARTFIFCPNCIPNVKYIFKFLSGKKHLLTGTLELLEESE